MARKLLIALIGAFIFLLTAKVGGVSAQFEPKYCKGLYGNIITDWTISPPNPKPGDQITVEILSASEQAYDLNFFVAVNPKCEMTSQGGGYAFSSYGYGVIFVTSSGTGRGTFTLRADTPPGEYQVQVMASLACSSLDPELDICSNAQNITVEGEAEPEPGDCLSVGSPCLYYETNLLCEPEKTYCHVTDRVWGTGTVRSYGEVASSCTLINGEYTCSEGVPTSQDSGCICRPESLSVGMANVVANECLQGPGWVDTAIGCIPFSLVSDTTKFFLSWSFSIGGGIGLLLIGVSAFMFATSGGNPEKLNSSKSLFFAAISGLLMIILALFLLRFIGYDLLGLFG